MQGAIRTDSGLPNIVVTPKNVARALRLLDVLLKNFRLLGYNFELRYDGLNVCYKKASFLISIREKSNIVYVESEHDWDRRRLIPNGKLAIKIWHRDFEFIDKEAKPLEKQIEKILATIEREYQSLFQIWEENEIRRKKEEEQRLIQLAIQQRKDDELSKFKEFNRNAHRWNNYLILKNYYEEVIKTHSEDEEWIEWAKNKLDWYNPFFNEKDDLLTDKDKEEIY